MQEELPLCKQWENINVNCPDVFAMFRCEHFLIGVNILPLMSCLLVRTFVFNVLFVGENICHV